MSGATADTAGAAPPGAAGITTDVVIGAGSGMGAAVAARLIARGNRLLLADRDGGAASSVAASLGSGVGSAACDITDAEAVGELVERVAATGALGALVLTAGLSPNQAPGRTIHTVNLIASDAVVRAFEPTLAAGSVGVVFASMAGHMVPADPAIDALLDDPGSPGFIDGLAAVGLADDSGLAYSISKRGVLRLVERRAAAWGRAGARLLSLSPGVVDTPMGRLESANQPEMAGMVANSALAREGTADEIAAVVSFLVSEEASFLTGTDVRVDGGATAAFRHRAA